MAYPGLTLENPASASGSPSARPPRKRTASSSLSISNSLRAPACRVACTSTRCRRSASRSSRHDALPAETGKDRRRPGAVVVVPPGLAHDFANAGDEDALVRVEIRPALKMEQLFETAVALAEEGRTMRKGIPKPLDLALFTRAFEQEVQAAFTPLWMQRLALAPLAWLAKRRGYASRYTTEPTATQERHAIEARWAA
jgi:hypothetical protein